MTLEALRERVRTDQREFDLLDDPDCLAEMEFTYEVFRFRYSWGTMYEVSFTNHADGDDRAACWGLIPNPHLLIDCIDTDTMGVGHNGVTREITHRLVAAL